MDGAEPFKAETARSLHFSAATSAFQIEGGRSIWDDFVDTPRNVIDGSTAEPGPDSYHRVDGLLAAGVTPEPTLYHWDLPVALEAVGGWLNRDTAHRFGDYAEVVADRLGDRVRHWYTINEPASTSLQGYALGELAPGRSLLFEALPTVRSSAGPVPFEMVPTPGAPVTGFGPMWPIRPDTMRDFLIDMAQRYGSALPPIVITENGASFPESETTTTEIDDSDRIDYLNDHLGAVIDAKSAGVRIDGYTVWSLLDNFEWADGWSQRFGLVHVDMRTGMRTPKASYRWYRDLIAAARS